MKKAAFACAAVGFSIVYSPIIHARDTKFDAAHRLGKSDETACNWAFLSAMVTFEKRAKELGAHAVVNIVSYYKKSTMSSTTEFECHAGALIAGVALKGDFITIVER